MLTSLNRMVGLPVVWQDRQLGYVAVSYTHLTLPTTPYV